MAQLSTKVQHAVKSTHRRPLSAQTEEHMRCMWQYLSYFQCFIQPQKCRERRWEWNITMLPDPTFSTAELSITSRCRTGTRQKKQNRGIGGGNSCQESVSVLIPQECTTGIYSTVMTATDTERENNTSCPWKLWGCKFCFCLFSTNRIIVTIHKQSWSLWVFPQVLFKENVP